MKTISVIEAQKQLPDLVNALEDGPVLLLCKGQPCAALVGLNEHFDREAFSVGRNKRIRQLIDAACRRTRQAGGIPFSEILSEMERLPRNKTQRRRTVGKRL